MEENKCEKCGTTMVSFKEGRTIGMKCPNCGWGWATTQFDPIDLDETIYSVKFDVIINPSKEQLKIILKMLNVNFLITAKLLKEGTASFNGKAIDIQSKLKELYGQDIHYSISPDFKYEI